MTGRFKSIAGFSQILSELPEMDADAYDAAVARDATLTKPPGALGRLENLALWYCGWRGNAQAQVNAPQVIVFAGNHGVTDQGVSAFPSDVTAQMVNNFENGGAAINQISDSVGASLTVKALQLETPTQDISLGPAMTQDDVTAALLAGWDAVDPEADLVVVGEMGIGNTTSAAAIALALYGGTSADWTGAGTGVVGAELIHKADIVARAVATNPSAQSGGLEALRCLGGREIAAMAGAMIRARSLCIPVILDGFICTAAAACLHHAQPGALDHTVAGHVSAETAHATLLEQLKKPPLLSLSMRLGEASGATLAIAILKAALACHSGMANFSEAGVTEA